MKLYLVYFLSLLLTFAFNNILGQKGAASLSVLNQQNPGIVELRGLIKSVIAGDTLCNKRYESALIIEVEEVISPGRNLVNSIAKGQDLTLALSPVLVKKLKSEKSLPTVGQRLSIMAKEKLCQDASQSLFTILALE